jgi:SAM-dependent methyltransferase
VTDSSVQAVENRAERERDAFNSGSVWEHADRWHRRFPHVFASPNTVKHEQFFENRLRSIVSNRRVLELGCGDGDNAARLLSFGASYVYGIDVSDACIERAQRFAQPRRLEFATHDASQPIAGDFDAIVGRGVLHHMDYRRILRRLYAETMRPNGTMIFMEPLGSNPLIRLYRLLVPKAHTADERSFDREDVEWFRREFAAFEFHPFNLASLPAGIVSSYLFSRADNALLRMTDAIDTWLAGRSLWLDCQFRYAILVVRKTT